MAGWGVGCTGEGKHKAGFSDLSAQSRRQCRTLIKWNSEAVDLLLHVKGVCVRVRACVCMCSELGPPRQK